MEDNPLVFDHIARLDDKGRALSLDEFAVFASSVATRLIEERGELAISSIRLLSANVPCVITDKNIYMVSFSMYPEYAIARAEDIKEVGIIARAIGKKAFSFPISFASLSEDPSKMIAGVSYLVRPDDMVDIK